MPRTMIRSLIRPVMNSPPFSSRNPRSPVRSQSRLGWFCHVSRHLRCVALVELLIDHPACMMRIAMRA